MQQNGRGASPSKGAVASAAIAAVMKAMILALFMVNISLLNQIQSGHFFEARQRLFVIRNLQVVIKFSVNDCLKIADHV